jgi:hypothetical protein
MINGIVRMPQPKSSKNPKQNHMCRNQFKYFSTINLLNYLLIYEHAVVVHVTTPIREVIINGFHFDAAFEHATRGWWDVVTKRRGEGESTWHFFLVGR